ncbi:Cox family DNA-binding protein, partial [Escherichia coli]
MQQCLIKYPLDAVHAEKFADLLGKPKTAVTEMIKANKLPVIELRDP